MKVAQFRATLLAAAHHYKQDGRLEEAAALSLLATNLLEGVDSQTVAQFVARVHEAKKQSTLNSADAPSARKKRGGGSSNKRSPTARSRRRK